MKTRTLSAIYSCILHLTATSYTVPDDYNVSSFPVAKIDDS